MLHPVGELPAVVYWRRRALAAGVLVALGVGGGVSIVAAAGGGEPGPVVAAPSAPPAPALEEVVPSLSAVDIPADATQPPAAEVPPPPVAPGFTEGQACSDEMIAVDVRPEPAQAQVGSKPTFVLVVTNTSPVSCTRSLDADLREIVLVDGSGARVWGSNDCYPEASNDPRTLAVGEEVALPIRWSGLTSDPACADPRINPPPGRYQLQGRLDTAVGTPTPFELS